MNARQQTHLWYLLIGEPWGWFSHSFFQPVHFNQTMGSLSLKRRLCNMMRMILVILLFSYIPVLLLRTLLCLVDVSAYSDYFARSFSFLDPGIIPFYFDAIWPPLLACIGGGLFCAFFSLRLGIAAAFAVSVATGVSDGNNDYTIVGMTFGLALGFIIGPLFNNIRVIKKEGLTNVTVGNLTGVLAGLFTGTIVGTLAGFWSGVAVATIGGLTLQTDNSILGSTVGLASGGIGSCLLFFLFGWCLRVLFKQRSETIDHSLAMGLAVAGAVGITVGVTCGDLGLSIGKIGFGSGIITGSIQGILFSGTFLPLYLLSYYRLPLYPISAFSMVRTYRNARRNPPDTLLYLQQSALHFDECVFLSLPFLLSILRLATEQNQDATLKEIEFIITERPQQSQAAQITAYEIALADLSRRHKLEEVSRAYIELPSMLSSRVRNLNVSVGKLFDSLEDMSRDAASYSRHNSISSDKRESYNALQHMLVRLHTIKPHIAFREAYLNRQLQSILELWEILALQAQETLNITINGPYLITNPYTAGPALFPVGGMPNPVFVGRNNIITRLHRALQKTPHPTFCLTGERRMGKSSILRQLPVLLGASYLPIFWDLHNPAAHASIAVFFAGLGEAIEEHLSAKHLSVEPLTRGQLEDALGRNEVAVYTEFDRWLKGIERVLEENNRTLLLTFDEFEDLEAFRQRGLLDLDLLLSWFRTISQNSRHIALLFCGVKTVYDMGPDWTRHFVNVERLKVSFLQSADAYDLINRPVSAQSTQSIFDEEVAQEIIWGTRCHPFLLQALCSKLIDNLNDASQEYAHPDDIAPAIQGILEDWPNYFWNQWQRSTEEQQRCLIALHTLEKTQATHLIQQSRLSAPVAYQALNQLQERDIVVKEQQTYQFAVPIFAQWIEENYHLL